jgi:hypothetical protein
MTNDNPDARGQEPDLPPHGAEASCFSNPNDVMRYANRYAVKAIKQKNSRIAELERELAEAKATIHTLTNRADMRRKHLRRLENERAEAALAERGKT